MSFTTRYDSTIRELESKLSDLIDAGKEFDIERKGDVLNIEFEDGEKIVITPQSPVEQLWISADYSGHRFDWKDDEWINDKTAENLTTFLERSISAKLGTPIEL